MADEWERVKDIVNESLELAKNGRSAEAFLLIDGALSEAIHDDRDKWASLLCAHGEMIALAHGERRRQILYKEQSLKYSNDFAFAAYNLALLLLADGQDIRAEHYAAESYKVVARQPTQAQRDLLGALIRQWPSLVCPGSEH